MRQTTFSKIVSKSLQSAVSDINEQSFCRIMHGVGSSLFMVIDNQKH